MIFQLLYGNRVAKLDSATNPEHMKVAKIVLPAKDRYALYVDVDLGERVKSFHEEANNGRPLWVSAEAVVEAGLKALGVHAKEADEQQLAA